MPPRRWLRLAVTLQGVAAAGLGLWLIGGAGAIHAKAWLAQLLLERAWQESLAGSAVVRPWPWADTYPVARLRLPDRGIDRIVLAGASGRSLAFGPGHLDGTAAPGVAGHMVLSAHRDTHFRFLEGLAPGTVIRLQTASGDWLDYRVRETAVIDARDAWFTATPGRRNLTLVTCYPFDAILPGGPLRYLVQAEALEPEDRSDGHEGEGPGGEAGGQQQAEHDQGHAG